MQAKRAGRKTRWAYWIDHLIAQRVSSTVTNDKELAEKSGLSPASLSNLKAEDNPTLGKLQKVADAFGVDVSALVLPTPSEAAHASSSSAVAPALRAIDFSTAVKPAVRSELIVVLTEILTRLHASEIAAGYDAPSEPHSSDRPVPTAVPAPPREHRR